MKLSTPSKILLLIATLIPPVYLVLFMATFFAPAGDQIFQHFAIVMAVHVGIMLLMWSLIAFYLVFLFRTPRVTAELKALWAVVLFLGGPISMPIFWKLYVWPADDGG